MKSKVDIFRPLAAATRGCRPTSAASIFRRSHKRLSGGCTGGGGVGSADADDESIVISVPPGEWPPHKTVLGSASDSTAPQKLKASAPLPAHTSSGEEAKSPQSPSRAEDAAAAPTTTVVAPPPSYYKIEMNDNKLQLTAGDDASVQFTPEVHNQRIRLDGDDVMSDSVRRLEARHGAGKGLARAAPVASTFDGGANATSPGQASAQASDGGRKERWTISDRGEIVAVPPSPRTPSAAATSATNSSKVQVSEDPRDGRESDLSLPPRLVPADSSDGNSSCDSLLASDDADRADLEAVSLESPPRMSRSTLSQSLFEDSASGSSRSAGGSGGSSSRVHCVKSVAQTTAKRSGSDASGGGAGRHSGGCGTRSLDFLGMVLDAFSLNGTCCSQDAVGCR